MPQRSPQMLVKLLQKKPVAQFSDLRKALGGASDATVFRHLKLIHYRSSYNCSGRYYALHKPERYDRWGLLSVGDGHFSIDGTARATVTRLVRDSEAGWTQGELQELMRIRVQSFLLAAVRDGRIERERFGRVFVYFHADTEAGRLQRRHRRNLMEKDEVEVRIDHEVVVRVLLVLLRYPGSTPGQVVRHLAGKTPPISHAQIDLVFARHGLGEKGGPRIF